MEKELVGKYTMPGIGIGTLGNVGDAGSALVEAALAEGYRYIDTSRYYGNEEAVGRALARSSVPRGDIWVTTRKTKNDTWGTPVNLGSIVNSSAWDQAPSISDDGLTLYFDSEVSGKSEIWVTTRKKTDDPWGTPIKLGPVVNADWEANPDISRDGSTLYFVSTRDRSGGCDLWQVSLKKQGVKLHPDFRALD